MVNLSLNEDSSFHKMEEDIFNRYITHSNSKLYSVDSINMFLIFSDGITINIRYLKTTEFGISFGSQWVSKMLLNKTHQKMVFDRIQVTRYPHKFILNHMALLILNIYLSKKGKIFLQVVLCFIMKMVKLK